MCQSDEIDGQCNINPLFETRSHSVLPRILKWSGNRHHSYVFLPSIDPDHVAACPTIAHIGPRNSSVDANLVNVRCKLPSCDDQLRKLDRTYIDPLTSKSMLWCVPHVFIVDEEDNRSTHAMPTHKVITPPAGLTTGPTGARNSRYLKQALVTTLVRVPRVRETELHQPKSRLRSSVHNFPTRA